MFIYFWSPAEFTSILNYKIIYDMKKNEMLIKRTELMRSNFQSLAANKLFVDYVNVIDKPMISS